MERRIITFLEENNINLDGKKIVLAVSTGIDSMVMLHAFMQLTKKLNFSIVVAHVNHQKRLQSQQEEEFIQKFCRDNKLICYVKRLDFSSVTENFQAEARRRRYEFFQEVLVKEKAEYLALAHHGNDVLETIMMRLLRGSSLSGYAGMKAVVPFNNQTIIRPFLTVLKSDLEKYQQLKHIEYFEDQSNMEDVYTRNRLRKEIIPALIKEDQNVHLKFLEFSETLEEANAELHKIRDNFIQKKVIFGKESVSFNIPDFKKLSVYMQTEVLYELLKKYNLGKANIVELLKLVNSSKANHEVLIKKDLTFVKEYNKIYFFFKELIDESINIVIHELKKYQITDNIAINVTKKTTENITNDNSICYNSDKLPLVVRSRKPADKIKLSQGYKKVKDLLIDKKIGILQRKRVLILEDDSHEILAVLGIKKSEKLKEIKVKDILISMEEKTNGQFY